MVWGLEMARGPAAAVERRVHREFFVYSSAYTAVSGNATSNLTVQISNDADFELHKMTFVYTSTAFTIQIQDNSTSKLFFDRALRADIILGTAQNPMVLAIPRRIRANSSLQLTITDTSGSTNSIQVGFVGYKVYGE